MAVEWDEITDIVVVGSGGGLAGALAAAEAGADVIVVEKEPFIGGSTGISGGVVWLPNNPLMQRDKVPDSVEQGLAYFADVVGDIGPASTLERRRTYIESGAAMVRFLERIGYEFHRPEGYTDYYAEAKGGQPRGRSIEPKVFDLNTLGAWADKLRAGFRGIAVYTGEAHKLGLVRRTPGGVVTAAKVARRTMTGKVLRQKRTCNGPALIGRLLGLVVQRNIRVWTETPLAELVVEDGVVTGIVAERGGERINIRARRGVLLSAGGFSRNPELRERYSFQPNHAEWSSASPGETGDALQAVLKHFDAALDLMDDAWWMPSAMPPSGVPQMVLQERIKPGSIMVDANGKRFMNEALPYMEAGQRMYQAGAVPSWLILDNRFRRRYPFGFSPPGVTPNEWITSGFMKRADTLEGLADQCGIDPANLVETVKRFNRFAETGVDADFHRGETSYSRYYGDPRNGSNHSVGALDTAPYYAVALYPGDVGTSGGLVCDEYSRVLENSGKPIAGLYAAGNITASVHGRSYLGAGASIGATLIYSFVAARHAMGLDPSKP